MPLLYTSSTIGVKGAEYSYPAYRIEDYERILGKLNKLKEEKDFCIVVVGGGLTGVEVAGELGELYGEKVVLVEKMKCLLPFLKNPEASKVSEEYLTKELGIRVITGAGVEKIEEKGVYLENGEYIPSDLTIWCTGIRASKIVFENDFPKKGRGWIVVKKTLQVEGFNEVFAVGDINCFEVDGVYAMKMAEEAIVQAKVAVENIKRLIDDREKLLEHTPVFTTESPKTLLSLGKNFGLMVWGRKIVSGALPFKAKMLLEKIFISLAKDKPLAGAIMNMETKILKAVS